MKTAKDLIADACKERANIPPVWIIDAEIWKDGSLLFSYSFSEKRAKKQSENTEEGLLDGIYEEIIAPSPKMYAAAAHYIFLQWQEAARAMQAGKNRRC